MANEKLFNNDKVTYYSILVGNSAYPKKGEPRFLNLDPLPASEDDFKLIQGFIDNEGSSFKKDKYPYHFLNEMD